MLISSHSLMSRVNPHEEEGQQLQIFNRINQNANNHDDLVMRLKKPRDQRVASFMPSGLKIIKANSSTPIDLRIVRKVQNNLDLGRSLLMKSKSTASNTESFDIEVLNIPITLTEEEARRFFLQYGKILSVNLQPFTRRCFVSFQT